MKKYSIILFFILQIISISGQNDTLCQNYNIKSTYLIDEFQMDGNVAKLDSALYYVEKAIPICSFRYQPNLVGRKLGILSLKHEYNIGIDYIKTINDSLLPAYPYYKTVLIYRFYAMKSLYEGDTIQRNNYINLIIENIHTFINENQTSIDNMCKEELSMIFKNTMFFTPMQYYYYKSVIEDPIIFEKELNSLLQKGYNPDYIEWIRTICEEDFLIFQLF